MLKFLEMPSLRVGVNFCFFKKVHNGTFIHSIKNYEVVFDIVHCVTDALYEAMGAGTGELVNGAFWFIVLIFISWWVASFCFVPYVICSVFTPCINGLKSVTDLLLAGVMFPYKCSDNMVHRRSYNSI